MKRKRGAVEWRRLSLFLSSPGAALAAQRPRVICGCAKIRTVDVEDFLGRWEPPDDADIAIDTSNDPDVVAVVDRIVTLGTN